jgi:uncharacterized membrane protein YecN with MAPEG domain
MTILPVTLTITGAAAIVNFWLAVRCAALRVKGKILIGDGGDIRLTARMRAHSNYVEYTPFVLILMALIELATGTHTWLWVAGILYILARICHAFGLDRGTANILRGIGMLVTFIVMLGLAGYALWLPYVLRDGAIAITH